jgi:PAS domain S-box-containing protein
LSLIERVIPGLLYPSPIMQQDDTTTKAPLNDEFVLSRIVDSIPDAIWSMDIRGRLVALNSNFKALFYVAFGFVLEEGMNPLEKMPPARKAFWEGIHQDALNGKHRLFEQRYEKDGLPEVVEISASPVRDENGQIAMVVYSGRDISKRISHEEVLKESKEKYRKLIDSASDAIIICDAETGIISDVNRKAENLLGLHRDKIIGLHQSRIHPPEDAELYRAKFSEHVRNESVITGNVYVIRSDGRKIPVEITGSVVDVGGHKIIQGIFRDLTDRIRIQKALMKSELKVDWLSRVANCGWIITSCL